MCSCFVLRKRSSDIVIIEMRDNLKYKFISGWLRVLSPPPAPSPPPPPLDIHAVYHRPVCCSRCWCCCWCYCWCYCCSVLHCRCTLQAELVPATRVSTAVPVSTMVLGISPVSVTPASTALAAKVSTDIQTASPKE